jgi:hypothetical protein
MKGVRERVARISADLGKAVGRVLFWAHVSD